MSRPSFVAGRHSSPVWLVRLSLIALLAVPTSSQAAPAPNPDWRRTDFFPDHPVTGPQTRTQSGEDWWYDHANSYAGGTLNGFICAGYSGFVNYEYSEVATGGCVDAAFGAPDCNQFESAGNVKGSNLAALALLPTDGSAPIWYRTYNEGFFYRVIQTSDGGCLAVGTSGGTRTPNGAPLYYNPGQEEGELTDEFGVGSGCSVGQSVPHLILVRTDSDGDVLWQYLYGMVPYRNASGVATPADAFLAPSDGWDVVETPGGGFRVVGNARDPEHQYYCNNQYNPLTRACMIEVDSDGHWLWGDYIGFEGTPSNGAAITTYGTGAGLRYIVATTQFYDGTTNNPYIGCSLFQRVQLTQYGPEDHPAVDWQITSIYPSSTKSQSTYDVAIASNGEILLPLITECTNCLYAGFNQGTAKVFRFNVDGEIVSELDFGTVTAYDLKARVTTTSDGGYAIVSSKQVTPPPGPYGCYTATSYWNTDAFVAKVSACGQIEWQTTFDVDDQAPAAPPGDHKKQECLYTITEAADQGLVVSGNNSANFDDCYLAKLEPGPVVAGDLWIGDTYQDIGIEPNPDTGPMWVSDHIWIRNEDDFEYFHQNPEYSPTTPNYVYVTVYNRGCVPMSGDLRMYWAKASTGLGWPAQWVNAGVLGQELTTTPVPVTVPPGQGLTVSVPWLVPDPDDYASFGADAAHFCLLARVETSGSAPFGFSFPEGTDLYANVRNNNNAAWKNVTIVDYKAGKAPPSGDVVVRNIAGGLASIKLRFKTQLLDPALTGFPDADVTVDLGDSLYAVWQFGGMQGQGVAPLGSPRLRLLSQDAWIGNVIMGAGQQQVIRVENQEHRGPHGGPDTARVRYNVDVFQYRQLPGGDQLVGGQRFRTDLTPLPCIPLPSGAVAWWPLDETSGIQAVDLVGASHGNYVNGALHASGRVAGGVHIATAAQQVLAFDSANLDVGTGSFSLDGWVRSNGQATQVRTLVDKRAGAPYRGYSLYMSYSHLGAQLADGTGFTNFTSSGPSLTDGAWHHVACVVDRSAGTTGGRLYVDGQLVHTFDPTMRPGSLNNSGHLRIGQAFDESSAPFDGALDEIQLFSRALTPQEIQAIYLAGFAGQCRVPVACVPLPGFTIQPVDVGAYLRGAAKLSAKAANFASAYAWYRAGQATPLTDGNGILGSSTPNLTINPVTADRFGDYYAVAFTPCGGVISETATIRRLYGPVDGPWEREDPGFRNQPTGSSPYEPGVRLLSVAPRAASGDVVRYALNLPAAGRIQLQLLDTEGRVVHWVLDQVIDSGRHWLDWRVNNSASISSGVYFLRASTPDRADVQKLVILR